MELLSLCSLSLGFTTLHWILFLLKVSSMKSVIHMSTVVTDFFIAKTCAVIPCVATTSTNGLKQAFHFIKLLTLLNLNSHQLSVNTL